jgi:hypothetical protein
MILWQVVDTQDLNDVFLLPERNPFHPSPLQSSERHPHFETDRRRPVAPLRHTSNPLLAHILFALKVHAQDELCWIPNEVKVFRSETSE